MWLDHPGLYVQVKNPILNHEYYVSDSPSTQFTPHLCSHTGNGTSVNTLTSIGPYPATQTPSQSRRETNNGRRAADEDVRIEKREQDPFRREIIEWLRLVQPGAPESDDGDSYGGFRHSTTRDKVEEIAKRAEIRKRNASLERKEMISAQRQKEVSKGQGAIPAGVQIHRSRYLSLNRRIEFYTREKGHDLW